MKFEVYANKTIFESILLDSKKYPNWNAILLKHSYVLLDLTEKELEDDLSNPDESVIFHYYLSTGSSSLHALKNYFEDLRTDGYGGLEGKPTSMFLLDINDNEVNSLREELGMYIANLNLIDDYILAFEHYVVYEKDEVCRDENSEGWHCINKFERVELNAIIVNDTHLFDNDIKTQNCGVENLLYFLDTMLPTKLNIPFHILVLAKNSANKNLQPFVEDLYKRCKALRKYEINFEILIGASVHKRAYFANYFTGSLDKGFYFFTLPAREIVKDVNDHRCEGTFKGVANGVQKPDQLRVVSLRALKTPVKDVLGRMAAKSNDMQNFAFGDLGADNSIKNRLYNDLT